jgi:hypothetical protein
MQLVAGWSTPHLWHQGCIDWVPHLLHKRLAFSHPTFLTAGTCTQRQPPWFCSTQPVQSCWDLITNSSQTHTGYWASHGVVVDQAKPQQWLLLLLRPPLLLPRGSCDDLVVLAVPYPL